MRVAVIGAGHQGLVAAVLLARAGCDVTVLEQSETPGGCVWTQTVDGVSVERGAVDHGGVAAIAAELGLERHGLRWRRRDLGYAMLFGDGVRLDFDVSAQTTAARFGHDAPGYLGLAETASTLFGLLDQIERPPTMTELAVILTRLRGGDELFRTLLSSASVVAERAVADRHLRAAITAYAAHGQVPPWAPGSGMFALLLPGSHGSPAVRPEGGSGALVAALLAALEAAGGRVRCRAVVDSLAATASATTASAVTGRAATARAVTVRIAEAATAAGEPGATGHDEIEVDAVISTLDVRRTAGVLADPAPLAAAAASVGSGRLNVAELTVGLVHEGAAPVGVVASSPESVWFLQHDTTDLHRSFGDLIAGRLPSRPWAMLTTAVQDRPDAGSALWLSSVVPLSRADGAPWTPEREREAALRVVEAASQVVGTDLAGGSSRLVVTGPGSWAERIGGSGSPNHLDLTIDQLLGWRPPGVVGHRTALPWLYLAGAGTHPGGGLSGASGQAAAAALLADMAGRPRRRSVLSAAGAELAGMWAGWQAYRSMRGGVR